MCLLLAAVDVVDGHPLVCLANRDEYHARASEPPALRGGDPAVVCGLDVRAGGTWLGMSAAGVIAVITNRPGDEDAARPSRGRLCFEALGARSAAAGAARAADWAGANGPNPFSLFVGDATSAFAVTFDGPPGPPRTRVLGPGLHTLSNLHDVDELDARRVLDVAPGGAITLPEGIALDAASAALTRLARSHATLDATRNAVCVHDDANARGTVSAAVLAIDAEGRPARYLAADGRPCREPFRAVALP